MQASFAALPMSLRASLMKEADESQKRFRELCELRPGVPAFSVHVQRFSEGRRRERPVCLA